MTTQLELSKEAKAFRAILTYETIFKACAEAMGDDLPIASRTAFDAILAMDDSLEQIAQWLSSPSYSYSGNMDDGRAFLLGRWPEWLTRETLLKLEAAGYAKHEHGGPATFAATTWYIYPKGGANA